MILVVTKRREVKLPDMRQVVHFGLTGVMAWLSVTILLPGDSMTGASSTEMIVLASEETWGYIFGVLAIIGLVGLLVEFSWVIARLGRTACIWINLVSAFIVGLGHVSLVVLFYDGFNVHYRHAEGIDPPPWTGSFIFLAMFAFYLVMRRAVVAYGIAHEGTLVLDTTWERPQQ